MALTTARVSVRRPSVRREGISHLREGLVSTRFMSAVRVFEEAGGRKSVHDGASSVTGRRWRNKNARLRGADIPQAIATTSILIKECGKNAGSGEMKSHV